MDHVVEPAASGRARCRACCEKIAKGELRLGERLPNPFADEGDMTVWFHLTCGAYKRPEPFLAALGATSEVVPDRERLETEARRGLEHRRLPRLGGAERAPSGRARCRECRETIGKGDWRIRLVFYEDGRFSPGGFVHVACAGAYFGTADVLPRLRSSGAGPGAEDLARIEALLGEA